MGIEYKIGEQPSLWRRMLHRVKNAAVAVPLAVSMAYPSLTGCTFDPSGHDWDDDAGEVDAGDPLPDACIDDCLDAGLDARFDAKGDGGASPDADVDWWNPTFQVKYPITIDADSGLSADTPFPLKLVLDSSNIDYAKFQADGGDLRLIDSTETTELDYFIEKWDPAGTSIVYVNTTISNSASNTIFLYGDASTSQVSSSDFISVFGSELMLFYSFNDDASDLSDNDLDGTITGETTHLMDYGDIEERKYGHYEFDGDDDYIQSPAFRVESATYDYSVSGWFNVDSFNLNDGIITQGSGLTNSGLRILLQDSGPEDLVSFYFGNGVSPASCTLGDVTGSWYHLVGVADAATKTSTLFLDGTPCGTGSWTNHVDITQPLYVGTDYWDTLNRDADGLVDEVRAYKRALSADEIILLPDQPAYAVGSAVTP
jgi:hypothetical protein